MKLAQRLRMAAQAWIRDVFSEETAPGAPGAASPEEALTGWLNDAQARLDALQVSLVKAQTRRDQLAHERQAIQVQADGLSAAVDAALAQGQEDLARARLADLNRLQLQAAGLQNSQEAAAQLVDALQDALFALQAQVGEARRKAQALSERASQAEMLEALARLRRDLNRQAAAIQAELAGRQEQIARREDRLAARAEIERRSRK